MVSLSYGLPKKLAERPYRSTDPYARPPADGLWHDGKLNMGPAILLMTALSLLGWGGVIGAAYLLYRLV